MLSEITMIKRKVLREVTIMALQDRLLEEIDGLPKRFTKAGFTNYRCCEYKERAILSERIKLALGVGLNTFQEEERLSRIAELAWHDHLPSNPEDGHWVTIIDKACDRCPIDRIVVTNACRNCVAHHCQNVCPKKAIEIVANQAFVIKEKCVECGLCAKACRFGAILQLDRPCIRACGVEAIGPGESASAKIDYEKCVDCGACIGACPFGAISERSGLLPVIRWLKSGESVVALVAPAFIGQFGLTVGWGAIEKALRQAGFSDAIPVASGADRIAREEGAELAERLKKGEKFLLNSCCPSFTRLTKLGFPKLSGHISHSPSPMLRIAKEKRAETPAEAKFVFIGPCVAKRREAETEGKGIIDAVLTFEELAALWDAAGISLKSVAEESSSNEFTPWGQGFCKAGGVGAAVKHAVHEGKMKLPGRRKEIHIAYGAGIVECIQGLKQLEKGELDVDFFEGMGCEGGCLGGPGTLVEAKASARALARALKPSEK